MAKVSLYNSKYGFDKRKPKPSPESRNILNTTHGSFHNLFALFTTSKIKTYPPDHQPPWIPNYQNSTSATSVGVSGSALGSGAPSFPDNFCPIVRGGGTTSTWGGVVDLASLLEISVSMWMTVFSSSLGFESCTNVVRASIGSLDELEYTPDTGTARRSRPRMLTARADAEMMDGRDMMSSGSARYKCCLLKHTFCRTQVFS